MSQHDLLIEIATEELPPKSLLKLSQAFADGVMAALEKQQLLVDDAVVEPFATPRRLALLIRQVRDKQPDQKLERRGPALQAAFNAEGEPTKAAEGFARSCGVTVAELEQQESDKGAWLFHRGMKNGTPTQALLPELLSEVLRQLPIDRRMRWGAGEATFVRPVQSLIVLFGDQVIPCDLFGLAAGRSSPGHRFLAPEMVEINSPSDYPTQLEQAGVIASFAHRRALIKEQTETAAAAAGGAAVIEPELLDEVTSLVEWPLALVGHFDARYLEVPAEALIAAMQDHQKYFPMVNEQGELLPSFITVSNLANDDQGLIRSGNERVLNARLADARFFWESDCQRTLTSLADELPTVLFQQKLGTLADRSRRISTLAATIATNIGADGTLARRAGALAKADLLSNMVGEFAALQGTMGSHYARRDGEPAAVAQAISEQYLPTQAGSELPQSAIGQALALADKLDTLVGIFGIGQNLARICIEGNLALDLPALLQLASDSYPEDLLPSESADQVYSFILGRLLRYYQDQGFQHDEIDSVLQLEPANLADLDRRIRAVAEFRKLPDAEALVAANKRITNILRKADNLPAGAIDPTLLKEPAEQQLAQQVDQLAELVAPLLESGRCTEALQQMATLRAPVDAFFDQVMVMDEQLDLRHNRMRLLARLQGLFQQVSDLSRLQG